MLSYASFRIAPKAAVGFFMCLWIACAQASLWTYSVSGIVSSGNDVSGMFGSPNTDLTGRAYTQTFTLDPEAFSNHAVYSTEYFADGSQAGFVAQTITLNGVSREFSLDLSQFNYGQTTLRNYLTQGLAGVDQAFQYQRGYTAAGQFVYGWASVSSALYAMQLALATDQVMSYAAQPGDDTWSFFDTIGIEGGAQFFGTPTLLAINRVPEPAAPWLFALGLLGLALFRRARPSPGYCSVVNSRASRRVVALLP